MRFNKMPFNCPRATSHRPLGLQPSALTF